MQFELTRKRDNTKAEFSVLEILNLLKTSDTVNDEILIKEEIYLLRSFRDLSDLNNTKTIQSDGVTANQIYNVIQAMTFGGLVIVMPGIYYENNNLAKNGILFLYLPGAFVVKTNQGALYDMTGITGCKVSGKGYFQCNKEVLYSTHLVDVIFFEYYKAVSTDSATINLSMPDESYNIAVTIIGEELVSNFAAALILNNLGSDKTAIRINKISSLAAEAVNINNSGSVICFEGTSIETTSATHKAILIAGATASKQPALIEINHNIKGGCYLDSNTGITSCVISGNIWGDITLKENYGDSHSNYIINGNLFEGTLSILDSGLIDYFPARISINGNLNLYKLEITESIFLTINGNIYVRGNNTFIHLTKSTSLVVLNGGFIHYYNSLAVPDIIPVILIENGQLVLGDNIFKLTGQRNLIRQTGGKLIIKGELAANDPYNETTIRAEAIRFEAGILELLGGKITVKADWVNSVEACGIRFTGNGTFVHDAGRIVVGTHASNYSIIINSGITVQQLNMNDCYTNKAIQTIGTGNITKLITTKGGDIVVNASVI